jgi:nicotinate-nucleotide adenylyltransferase
VANHRVLVYPRVAVGREPNPTEVNKWLAHPQVEMQDAPMIAISSTYIRDAITSGKDVQFLLPDAVIAYIGNNHFYEG